MKNRITLNKAQTLERIKKENILIFDTSIEEERKRATRYSKVGETEFVYEQGTKKFFIACDTQSKRSKDKPVYKLFAGEKIEKGETLFIISGEEYDDDEYIDDSDEDSDSGEDYLWEYQLSNTKTFYKTKKTCSLGSFVWGASNPATYNVKAYQAQDKQYYYQASQTIHPGQEINIPVKNPDNKKTTLDNILHQYNSLNNEYQLNQQLVNGKCELQITLPEVEQTIENNSIMDKDSPQNVKKIPPQNRRTYKRKKPVTHSSNTSGSLEQITQEEIEEQKKFETSLQEKKQRISTLDEKLKSLEETTINKKNELESLAKTIQEEKQRVSIANEELKSLEETITNRKKESESLAKTIQEKIEEQKNLEISSKKKQQTLNEEHKKREEELLGQCYKLAANGNLVAAHFFLEQIKNMITVDEYNQRYSPIETTLKHKEQEKASREDQIKEQMEEFSIVENELANEPPPKKKKRNKLISRKNELEQNLFKNLYNNVMDSGITLYGAKKPRALEQNKQLPQEQPSDRDLKIPPP